MKVGKIIIDVDICIKIGWIENVKLIQILVPAIAGKAYMQENSKSSVGGNRKE